jgi:hypothetical protein
MSPILGKEICTRYEADGSGLVAKVTIAGADSPAPDQPVKWVSPKDGYTVAP